MLESSDPPAATIDPDRRSPLSLEDFLAITQAQAKKPRFDGEVLGWRVAPLAVLDAEGVGRQPLARDCATVPAKQGTRTQLDFQLGYFPPDLTIGPVEGPNKILCDDQAISVAIIYNVDTPLGAGLIWVERSIQASRSLELDAPFDSVEEGSINGAPAIVVHPDDDKTGLGIGRVIVIEHDGDAEQTVLTVIADNGVPFEQLIKLAEGIK
jgi:hypothetical protein